MSRARREESPNEQDTEKGLLIKAKGEETKTRGKNEQNTNKGITSECGFQLQAKNKEDSRTVEGEGRGTSGTKLQQENPPVAAERNTYIPVASQCISGWHPPHACWPRPPRHGIKRRYVQRPCSLGFDTGKKNVVRINSLRKQVCLIYIPEIRSALVVASRWSIDRAVSAMSLRPPHVNRSHRSLEIIITACRLGRRNNNNLASTFCGRVRSQKEHPPPSPPQPHTPIFT